MSKTTLKLETVRQGADALGDDERSKELICQFAAWVVGDGGLRVRLQLEENLFPDIEGALRHVPICLFLEAVLSSCKLGA